MLRSTILFVLVFNPFFSVFSQNQAGVAGDGLKQRQYCLQVIRKIADPVLEALSRNELKKRMPVECMKGLEEDRKNFTYLEAFGRLLSGMAPWLELGPDESPEGKLRKHYIGLALVCLKNATDPESPDYMNFSKGDQPLVDAAFLAQALLRAPSQLWAKLDEKTKGNLIREWKSSRAILPFYSNWLLFSATIEAALVRFDKSGDRMRMDYAIRQHMLWYKGDGLYGDGPEFHMDYYNSFVIQPMLLEVLQVLISAGYHEQSNYDLVYKRARRYAAMLERLISPDGTYPAIGRSLAYRFGAFHLLSKMALMHGLPPEITPEQVRCALYTVIKKQIEAPGTFDANGWLQIGFYGHQPKIGERYISTGSLYLCSQAFLILGLPDTDPLWTLPGQDWTQQKVWKGQPVPTDHAID